MDISTKRTRARRNGAGEFNNAELLQVAIMGGLARMKEMAEQVAGWERQLKRIMSAREYAKTYAENRRMGMVKSKPPLRKTSTVPRRGPVRKAVARRTRVVVKRRKWSKASRDAQAARMRERWAARRRQAA